MKIREYNINDSEDIKDLLVELQIYVIEIDKYNLNTLSSEYREKYFEHMLQDCKDNQGKIFVATDNNKVIGMISGYIERYDDRDKLAYLCPKKGIIAELIVSKQARANGIGNLLLCEMEKYFKSLKCEFVQLDVFAYNDTAKNFYIKHNYEERMTTVFKKI